MPLHRVDGPAGGRTDQGAGEPGDARGGHRVAHDAALAALLAALGIAEAVVPFASVTGHGSVGVAIVLVLASCIPLALRRRFPLLVLLVVTLPSGLVALVTDVLVLFWGALVPMAVAVYTVARHGRGRTPYVGLGVAALALALMSLGNEALQSPGELFFPCLVFLVTWLAGLVISRKEHRARTSELRAVEISERSREEALLAIAEERARIARELHDVVAHAVTAMVVQAGAAGQVVEDDPAYARRALDGIRETGSRALDEMRRVVSLLRESEDHVQVRQPGLADLPTLVAMSSTTRTRVSLTIDGTPRRVSPATDLTAYRIAQEAITNAHRHACASEVEVRLDYGPDTLLVEVRDDGVGRGSGPPGHGLIGMRERVAAQHGQVEFHAGSGFTVLARLPVDDP